MNNFIIQLDVWCVISQIHFRFPLMFPSICSSGQMCKAIFLSQIPFVKVIFKVSKVENELLTYSCYVHSINFKLPFYICGCISLFSKANTICRGVWVWIAHKGRKKKRYLVANHQVLAYSFCWVLSFLGICFQHTNLF